MRAIEYFSRFSFGILHFWHALWCNAVLSQRAERLVLLSLMRMLYPHFVRRYMNAPLLSILLISWRSPVRDGYSFQYETISYRCFLTCKISEVPPRRTVTRAPGVEPGCEGLVPSWSRRPDPLTLFSRKSYLRIVKACALLLRMSVRFICTAIDG